MTPKPPGVPILLPALLAALMPSCDAGEPRNAAAPAAAPVIRDSAGVEIVENLAPAWSERQRWRVDAHPAVQIGVVDGNPDYTLEHVDSARRLPDGRIVVVDRGPRRLRFYSERGRFLHAAGREGEGPGEFRSLYTLHPYRGDSLMAHDDRLDRVSILDAEGRFGRSMPVPPGGLWAMGALRDSLTFLVTFGPVGMRDPRGTGTYRFISPVILAGPGGRPDTIARLPMRVHLEDDGRRARRLSFFLPAAAIALAHDRFFWAPSDAYEIGEYTADGRLARLIRRPFTPRPVNDSLRAAFEDAYPRFVAAESGTHSSPAQIRYLRRWMEDAYYPESLPALSAMIVDAQGFIWAENYRVLTDVESVWSVFDPTGRWLGEVQMPDGLHVQQIGRDFVLGIGRDELGVDHVRLHPLTRS